MCGDYNPISEKEKRKLVTASSLGIRTVRDIDGRVVHIRQDQSKLDAGIPVRWRFVFPSVFQVERCMFDMITVRKEKDPPIQKCQHQLVGQKR